MTATKQKAEEGDLIFTLIFLYKLSYLILLPGIWSVNPSITMAFFAYVFGSLPALIVGILRKQPLTIMLAIYPGQLVVLALLCVYSSNWSGLVAVAFLQVAIAAVLWLLTLLSATSMIPNLALRLPDLHPFWPHRGPRVLGCGQEHGLDEP